MLAGLIFATDDAQDRPEMLAATLPFGAATLIEFQARLLIGAGATQLIVVVSRLTPELIGAVNRMARRGVSVDVVRTAREAEEKMHPLARVIVIADGLVTTEPLIGLMSGEGGDALLVTRDADALPGLERVGADAIWAGLARIEPQRIADVAALPRDYDFESTLLRVTAQAGAVNIALPLGADRAGHGVERDSSRLRSRNDAVLTGHLSNRPAWVDRFVIAPLARRMLPVIVAHGITPAVVGGVSAVAALGGLGLIGAGWALFGLPIVLAGIFGLATGSVLSWMRDDQGQATAQRIGVTASAAAAVLLLGLSITRAEGSATALVVALTLVGLAGLVERGSNDRLRKRWWSSPAAHPLILLPFVLVGQPFAGLILGTCYAGLSLAAVIEALREKP